MVYIWLEHSETMLAKYVLNDVPNLFFARNGEPPGLKPRMIVVLLPSTNHKPGNLKLVDGYSYWDVI